MIRTLWEDVYRAGERYVERLKQVDGGGGLAESLGQEYVSMLDKLVETQVELEQVISVGQAGSSMTSDTMQTIHGQQGHIVEILKSGRQEALRSIGVHDTTTAVSSLDSLTFAWRRIAPWDYERATSNHGYVSEKEGSVSEDEAEAQRKVAEEADEAVRSSMDRNDMARVLECLNEGGQVREHYNPEFIWLLDRNGQSQGSVERRVVDLLERVKILRSEVRTEPYLQRQIRYYSFDEAGRKYVEQFGTYGEGEDSFWIGLDELRGSVAKL